MNIEDMTDENMNLKIMLSVGSGNIFVAYLRPGVWHSTKTGTWWTNNTC